jgi:arginase
MERRYAILEAPSVLGLKPTGVERLPQTLLRHGLAERLGARHAGVLIPPTYDPYIDPTTHMLNAPAIARWSVVLADAVADVLDRREFPVVLGGDCSILLGPALALRRRGRYGLLFVDGHADFYQPEANPTGEAASMDLALATGHGPAVVADLEGLGPLVRVDDAVAFGFRDAAEQRQYGSQPLPADLLAFDLPKIRSMGIGAAAAAAVAHVGRQELAGFFVHVDADVLDDAIMPAVDYRQPGGLSAHELQHTLATALATGMAVGVEVTIYNPRLDDDGLAGRTLARVLADALSGI